MKYNKKRKGKLLTKLRGFKDLTQVQMEKRKK